ncbi:ABC transporter ATP-binding protein [Arthrobacter sp. Br18]|uniref:ABC transporter transmembrane domain-containing protein n=1 Tax=Arthrobacter sp. Br18 TaxID=1312954 RepID=UPI000478C43F|nr:ABC transporter ATP-binding protein [Arthrobacter sp. Br18]
MRVFPYPDSGPPDTASPTRYLVWLASKQKATLCAGICLGSIWMAAQAAMPFLLGRAIDEGVLAGDMSALLSWVLWLLVLMVVQAAADTGSHRAAVSSWMQSAFRSAQLVGHKITRTGEALPASIATGEVVSTAASDVFRLGEFYEVLSRLAGAVAAWLVVTVLIWQTSDVLALLVLVGVPICCALLLFVVKPMQVRQREQREAAGRMTAVGADTVAGLRVLRGIGGESIFVNRYRGKSAATRDAGIRVARSLADLEASQVFIAGTFSVIFTWVGANLAIEGAISPGELVALYGFSIFLVTPIRAAADSVARFIRAHVGARKIIAVLRVEPNVSNEGSTLVAPPSGSILVDVSTGLTIRPGLITALVSADSGASAEVASRLGRFEDRVLEEAEVRWGTADLRHVAIPEIRSRIVVSEASPQLFTGSLRSQLDPHGTHDDAAVLGALDAASALDILDGIDDGLDSEVTERGRGFSGGQRQRLILARAFLTDAETLVLVEPTSAVDAHTEARIAARLQHIRGRRDRTTVVVTASPLLLGVMDTVVFLDAGRVRAEGTHSELMANNRAYRDVVIRSE